MSLKIKFRDYLTEFRNTRRILTTPAEMFAFSKDYGLGFEDEKDLPAAIYVYGFNKDSKDNSAWLVREKDGLYSTDISNSMPTSHLLSDVEYELAEYYYGEEYYYPSKYDAQQITFLNKVKDAVKGLRDSHRALAELWANDHNFDIDLNELLTTGYPFDHSFDEMDIEGWNEEVEIQIEKELATRK